MSKYEELELSQIPGYTHALAGHISIASEGLGVVYHGSATISPEEVRDAAGLPARGKDIDLIRHVEPPPGHDRQASAFRGTVPFPAFPAVSSSGAAEWAGVDGWVFQISSWRGYEVNRVLEGRVPDGRGGFRNPLMSAEHEVAIPAQVPARFVTKMGRVAQGRRGLVVDWE